MGVASQLTGLPVSSKPKAPTHRGGKARGKPGASHLAALQSAHGAGNFAQAKTHALNYAKAVHQATAVSPSAPVDDELSMAQPTAPSAAPSAPAAPFPPKAPPTNQRAQLAKLAMSRKK